MLLNIQGDNDFPGFCIIITVVEQEEDALVLEQLLIFFRHVPNVPFS